MQVRVHKGAWSHTCPQPDCHYSAAQAHHTKMHMLMQHPDAAKIHGCHEPGCGYRSNRKEHLTRHLRLRHSLGKANRVPRSSGRSGGRRKTTATRGLGYMDATVVQ